MGGIVTQNVLGNSGLVKAVEAGGGSWTLIKTLTASADGNLSFVNGTSDVVLDSTYPIYMFKFINIHCQTDNAEFEFNMSADTGSNYNVTKTTTLFRAYHDEADSATAFTYMSGLDLAQSTGVQKLNNNQGNDNDQSVSGTLRIFNPSNTTFVKHFIHESTTANSTDYLFTYHGAGYGNTTSAVDAIQFTMNTGNIDSGKIKLFGLKDS